MESRRFRYGKPIPDSESYMRGCKFNDTKDDVASHSPSGDQKVSGHCNVSKAASDQKWLEDEVILSQGAYICS